MERLYRLLRLARLRGDKAAIAILEGRLTHERFEALYPAMTLPRSAYVGQWSETELRAAWGDR